jgi:hypothetical protein
MDLLRPGPTTTTRSTSSSAASAPIRPCSSSAAGPSSAISPSTAQDRRPRAIVVSARSAAAIDSGLALYASLTTSTPSGRSVTSIRHRDSALARPSAAATPSSGMPSSSATAAAASELPTWWAPCTASVTGADPAAVTSR